MSFSKPAGPPRNLNGLNIDPESAALIAELAIQDLEVAYASRWGKSKVGGAVSDEAYAYQLQVQQYRELLTSAEDARLAVSLNTASESDAAYLDAIATAERAAVDDRTAAMALHRGLPLPPPTRHQTMLDDPTFRMEPESKPLSSKAKAKAKAPEKASQNFGGSDSDDDDDAETVVDEEVVSNQYAIAHRAKIATSLRSSSSTLAGPSTDRTKSVECLICNDKISHSSALRTPCGHYYCRTCIRDLVQTYTRDESLHPLRCCQTEIPIPSLNPYIPFNLKHLFDTKRAEFSVLAKDRIYCCLPTCSTYLGSSVGRENVAGVVCAARYCGTLTCPRCKERAHPNDPDCAVNKSTVELNALARTQGWQTCPGCHSLVELNVGCFHMTCRCRTQFCYLCAVRWKGCTCPQWDEGRLITTAEQRVVNQFGGARAVQMQAAEPEAFHQRVQRAAERLRVNHDCERHNWKYRRGGGRCEECHHMLGDFLLICRGCSLLACVRCSRNRL